jgi:hypothetical protein
MALFSLEEYESAADAFRLGAQHDASEASFKTWLRKCAAELEEESKQPAAPAAAPAAAQPAVAPAERVRHDWYQNATHVFLTLFVKGLKPNDVTVTFEKNSVTLSLRCGR